MIGRTPPPDVELAAGAPTPDDEIAAAGPPACSRERFAELEATVEQGLETSIQTGQALAEIRGTRAYLLAGYPSFNAYLEG